MKICFICGEYPPALHGGIGSMTRILGRSLARAGHEVRVIGVYPSLDGLAEMEEDEGVRVYRIETDGGRFGWARSRRRLFRNVAQWAERGEIDVVEVPDWQGYAAGWPYLPVPVVTRLHGSISYFTREMQQPIHWMEYCIEAASFHRANFCCSTSLYTAQRTSRLFGGRGPVPVLFNPVEVVPNSPLSRSEQRVVFAGTLTPKKGVVSLMESWPAVLRRRPDAELHLFGKDAGDSKGGTMRDRLMSILSREQADTVQFHGHVGRERLQEEFRECALAVFPSFAEAFSLAPMEAMAEGCPVIYSKRGSGPELIEPGVNGLLVDPARPEEIAESILLLLDDRPRRTSLGAAGYRTVAERFSSSVLTARNAQFYADCVARYA